MDLVNEDEEEQEHIRQCACWTRDEEILLTQCWIETSENSQIEADQSMIRFGVRLWMTSTMVPPKVIVPDICSWVNGVGSTVIAKSSTLFTNILNVKAGKMRRIISRLQRSLLQLNSRRGESFNSSTRPYTRPRPAGKTRPAKKTKSETKGSSGGSASGSISDFVSEDLRRKLQAGTSAYEAKKQKELAMMEFKEMEFLTIDAYQLPEPKASIIRRRQEIIIEKYAQ
ncbi:hypothetical protein Tco_0617276 [Tanacetum coccineum]